MTPDHESDPNSCRVGQSADAPSGPVREREALAELGRAVSRDRLRRFKALGRLPNARKFVSGELYWPTREGFEADRDRLWAEHRAWRQWFAGGPEEIASRTPDPPGAE
jgi:hypothetical protein